MPLLSLHIKSQSERKKQFICDQRIAVLGSTSVGKKPENCSNYGVNTMEMRKGKS